MNNSSNQTAASEEAIEAAAAGWLVLKDDGFTPEQAAEFTRWRQADPKHAAAVALLEETCDLLGKMPALCADPVVAHEMNEFKRSPASPPAKVLRFPRVLKIAVALAACFVVATFTLWSLRPAHEASANTYSTSAGGYLRVVLPDESVVELNAETTVRVQYSDRFRRVALVQGEAHFAVAKNPTRPFLVGAANVDVRAVGTAFNVRLDATAVEVLVTEGRVEVSRAEAVGSSVNHTASATPLVNAGQRIVVSRDTAATLAAPVTSVGSAAIHQALAWQSQWLTFADTSLTEVVQQFNQHNRVQLSIGDPELATRAVGGTFRADQVETFVRMLETSRDVALERPDAEHIVLRRVMPAR